jgi:hypothetical protein
MVAGSGIKWGTMLLAGITLGTNFRQGFAGHEKQRIRSARFDRLVTTYKSFVRRGALQEPVKNVLNEQVKKRNAVAKPFGFRDRGSCRHQHSVTSVDQSIKLMRRAFPLRLFS